MIIVKLYFLKYTIFKFCIFLDIIISNNFQKLKNKQYKMARLNRQDMVVINKTVIQFFLIQYDVVCTLNESLTLDLKKISQRFFFKTLRTKLSNSNLKRFFKKEFKNIFLNKMSLSLIWNNHIWYKFEKSHDKIPIKSNLKLNPFYINQILTFS